VAVWQVRVPASVANLGSGYDALGLALSLFLEVEGGPAEEDGLVYEGEGELALSHPGESLLHRAWRAAWARLGEAGPPLFVHVQNPIPLARGLGSSAAAAVAGAALADLASGGRLGRDGVFAVAAELEGHPDNAGASAYGGFVIGYGPPWQALCLEFPAELLVAVAVPPFEVPTERARAVLPDRVSRSDAVFNLARAALWPAALLTGRYDLLAEAAADRLHQDARLSLMPGAKEALRAAREAGALAAFVGGAGPAVAAVAERERVDRVAGALWDYAKGGQVMVLEAAGGYTWKEI